MASHKHIDRDILYELYYNQNLSAKEICKLVGVAQPNTVYRYMNLYGFKRRDANKVRQQNTMHGMDDTQFKQYLIEQYKTKSINQIARELNVTHTIIYRYMDKYGIKRYNQKESNTIFNKGNHNNYKGGRCSHGDGYVKLLIPDHPRANKGGYVLEHIVIAEKKIGRYLKNDEVVHHINGIKNDNDPDNLLILTKHEHSQLHKNGSNLYKSMAQIQKEGDFRG